MALNFPTSPANGDNYTYNGRTWRYNGTAWLAIGDPSLGGEYVPAGGRRHSRAAGGRVGAGMECHAAVGRGNRPAPSRPS